MSNFNHVVLDLDDTIYKEIEFVNSAYKFIIQYLKNRYNEDYSFLLENTIKRKVSLYDEIMKVSQIDFTLIKFLELYRFHYPEIYLDEKTKLFFNILKKNKINYSIITDGRSITQRNKIHALGLDKNVKKIIISEETGYEKPSDYNFKLMNKEVSNRYLFIGDNPLKDFYSPNILGWKTVCLLDNGKNIHNQSFDLDKKYLPNSMISNLIDIF